MKSGIISDSHGQTHMLAEAIDQLKSAGAQALVHCGDIENPDHVALLTSANIPVHLTAGNCDKYIIAELQQAAIDYDVNFSADFVAVLIEDGQFLAASHGHLQNLVAELIAGEQFPYVCLGHSHIRRNEQIGETRVLNPGSLYNPRREAASVLLLDTKTGKTRFIEI